MYRIGLYRVRYLRASSPEMPRISWLMVAESNATDRVESLKCCCSTVHMATLRAILLCFQLHWKLKVGLLMLLRLIYKRQHSERGEISPKEEIQISDAAPIFRYS